MKDEFLKDLQQIRHSARAHIHDGAVTTNYKLIPQNVIDILNHNLATELICVARYKTNYYKAMSLGEHTLAAEFLEHASEEQGHVDKLAVRIAQLGGNPEFNPARVIEKSHIQYVERNSAIGMIVENLIAERIAISTYRELIKYLGNDDSTTRRVIELILETEEEHADDMLDFFNKFKNLDHDNEVISQLKEEAVDLGLKMKASEENMDNPNENEAEKISNVIELLNELDGKHNYTCSEFIAN